MSTLYNIRTLRDGVFGVNKLSRDLDVIETYEIKPLNKLAPCNCFAKKPCKHMKLFDYAIQKHPLEYQQLYYTMESFGKNIQEFTYDEICD